MTSSPLRVRAGSLLAYRVFDVGDEIAVEEAEERARELPRRRTTIAEAAPDALEIAMPPLSVELGARTVELAGERFGREAQVVARLFDYGAVSVRFELPIAPGTALADLVPLCDELYDSDALDEAGRREVDGLVERLGAAVRRPHDWRVAETYTVVFVTELEDGATAKDVLAWPELAKLLIGEPRPNRLSAEERRDVLRHTHAYFEDDLAVIDWNSAFVLEPSGSRAIPDLLEFATSQLLELRYYDGLFDRELSRIYDDLEIARRRAWALFRSPYARLARGVVRRLVELTEFTERVDNALKVIGDFYLARVYQSAVERFRINAWRTSIDQKQALVAQAYALVKGELEARRATFLELVVIVLILLELLATLAALRH